MKFSFRRLLITILVVLFLGASAIISVFVATFDLNNFRAEIYDSISSRLSQPVNLGQARFTLKHGPSFTFDQVAIGTSSAPLHLTADHVFFRLEVLPLFFGKIKFTELLFESPDLVLKVGQSRDLNKSGRRLFIDQSLISGDLARSIRIKNGNIKIEDYRNAEEPFVVALEKLSMVVDDLSLRDSSWVEMKADFIADTIRSPFRLNGYIKAGDSNPFWTHANYELELRIYDFASDILSDRYLDIIPQVKIHGRSDIHVQVAGVPAEGLKLSTVLSGRDLGLIIPKNNRIIHAGDISLSGTWQHLGELHKLSDFNFSFGTINIFGDTSINLGTTDPEIFLDIRAPRIALTDFNRFTKFALSDTAESGPKFNAGTFSLKSLRLFGPVSGLDFPGIFNSIQNFDLEILQGNFSLNEKINFENFTADLEWAKNSLLIKQISARTGHARLDCNGEFSLVRPAEKKSLHISGQGRLNLDNLETGRELFPEKGLKASLHLDAFHKNGIWTIEDNLIAFPSVKILVNGKWQRQEQRRIDLDFTIPEFSLLDLPLISPAVRTLKPEGGLAANIHYSNGTDRQMKLTGSLSLDEVHLEIPGPLAALNRLNGTINLNWPYLGGTELAASLGSSPITLGLTIPDLTEPKVELTFSGQSIRADELIFRSERDYLRDVDANVTITDEALILGPIRTRMDGGTDVSINGTIDNFPAADTHLMIDGKYGNIDEVIGLWISEREYKRQKNGKKRQRKLEIDIRTDAGEISNLPFEQCEAHISYRDRTLVIHPISFKSGPGFGLGQILVVYRDDQPPLLKMSGHLEDFDALAVYQQLLQRKGIVTGRLRGDFYLEGTAGKLRETFLPSSFGAFNFEVRDGNLKKLRSLSEALTVFNIYPLFTSSGKERGVPFEILQGSARLDLGLLRTENMLLKGDVMNMSLSGNYNLIDSTVDAELGIMPLRTIDRLITKIPLAGWILAGENKALVTAFFKLTGPAEDPEVKPIPVESASKQILGVFERLFTLPVKIISDINEATK